MANLGETRIWKSPITLAEINKHGPRARQPCLHNWEKNKQTQLKPLYRENPRHRQGVQPMGEAQQRFQGSFHTHIVGIHAIFDTQNLGHRPPT